MSKLLKNIFPQCNLLRF